MLHGLPRDLLIQMYFETMADRYVVVTMVMIFCDSLCLKD